MRLNAWRCDICDAGPFEDNDGQHDRMVLSPGLVAEGLPLREDAIMSVDGDRRFDVCGECMLLLQRGMSAAIHARRTGRKFTVEFERDVITVEFERDVT